MRAFEPGKGCGRLSLVMLLFLAGCGGGGGGGGGGALPPLVYSGSTIQATVTTLNASRLAANVFGSNDTAGIISGTSIEGGAPAPSSAGMEGVARTLNRAARRALAPLKPTRSAQGPTSGVAQQVNFTVPCDFGMGSINTSGTLDDVTFTGTVIATFANCLLGGVTLNGQAAIQILAFQPFTCGPNPEDGIPTDFMASIPRVTIRGSGVSVDGGGFLRSQIAGPIETVTNNLITLNNATGVMTMGQNLVSVGTLDFVCNPTSISNLTFNGLIYDNLHGYVNVSTPTSLTFATLMQIFPDSGRIRLAGNASAVEAEAISSTRVRLFPDLNNDGTPDNTAYMNWTDLTAPVGADIGDTDVDGMHNSWEMANPPLNPNMMDGAGVDNDTDGADNLAEYIAGTNPNGP